ncbi:hypothetical protein M0R45_024909 [Rubus argutus]|uniref:FBD domain-containing protein n=1 Tax=Rubus argutus TaxID=59490 RepID=A0AAW1WSF2_RUBAR
MKRGFDRLSNLPCDVLEQFLACLPIKEAVRTSVLSRKWRYRWAMLSHLVFDEQCESTLDHSAFVNMVDRVLLLKIGPIHKFKLSHGSLRATSDIDRWILHLSRNSIKEFILHIRKGGHYTVPSCLFSCQDIIHLELFVCFLKPLPTFKGFRSLKSIYIHYVILPQDVFENLIGCSPLLESLTLIDCKGFTHLKINAPNLRYLWIQGAFEDVVLENASNLADAYICMEENVDQGHVGSSSNLLKFFVQLPQVRMLQFEEYFLKYLAAGSLPRKLPKPCLYLKLLRLNIFFDDLEDILAALCLLRSSPALQELELQSLQEEEDVVREVKSWLDDNQSCQLSQLRLVKIADFRGIKAELDFIRFLLLSSPVLESMTVKPISENGSSEILKKLVRFKRASVDAEIIYLDP